MENTNDLPVDLPTCHALIEQTNQINQALAEQLDKARLEIEELKRFIYGRRSERHVDDASQLQLFEEPVELPTKEVEQVEVVEEQITYRRKKRSKVDRFPENIQREVHEIDVPENERTCRCCGEEMPIFAVDERERLEFIPAKLCVHVLRYQKRACSRCKQAVTLAPPPESSEDTGSITKGSRYGFGVTAQIILGKYGDHLPLYRLEDVFARAGVVIPRSTQVDLLAAAADLVNPLVELMKTRVLNSPVIGMDDTTVRLQDPSLPGKTRTARMWLARGREEAPYNIFAYYNSRAHGHPERDGPARFLRDFSGYVTVDAYGVHDGVYLGSEGRILASCCHAHVRRKFEAAKGNDPKLAAYALAIYRRLFDIEDQCAEATEESRLAIRQTQSRPLMEQFKAWLDEQVANKRALPKSAIGKAIAYALNQWKALSVFLENGKLPIHNNDTERDLRRLTVGRKNWLFLGSEAGGEVAARMYSLVASGHRHQLDLWAYLDDVLRSLASGEANLESLLPDNWAKLHPGSIRTYRQQESLARAEKTKERRARLRKLAKR